MNFVRCVNSKPVFWQMVSPRDWVPHILLATHHVPIWLHSAWCQTRTSHTWTSYFMLSQVVVPQNSSSLLKLLKWDMHGMCLHLCMMMMIIYIYYIIYILYYIYISPFASYFPPCFSAPPFTDPTNQARFRLGRVQSERGTGYPYGSICFLLSKN